MDVKVLKVDFFGQGRAVIVGSDMNPISHIAEVTFANGWLSSNTSSWKQNVESAQPVNTQIRYARSLLNVLKCLSKQGVHIVKRVKTGQYMTLLELDQLARNACLKESAQVTDNVVSFSNALNVSTKQLDNATHEAQRSVAKHGVATGTAKVRLLTFQWFMEYLHDIHHETAPDESEVAKNYNKFNKQLSNEIKKLKSVNTQVDDPFEKAIPDEVMEKLQIDLQAESPNNPFKGSKLRNECIWRVFVDTGARNGAIAKLKISDIRDDGYPRLHITNSRNDPTDPRIHKAEQKTQSGIAPISAQTRELLICYINEVRSQFQQAMLHDFLFIAEKGKSKGLPLALKTYAYLFEQISKHAQFHITPHSPQGSALVGRGL